MINILLFLCCTARTIKMEHIGSVDSVDSKICTIQLKTGELETLKSKLCPYLKEGDKIIIEQKNEK